MERKEEAIQASKRHEDYYVVLKRDISTNSSFVDICDSLNHISLRGFTLEGVYENGKEIPARQCGDQITLI